ncbi:unnamed protein product [Orchesella dallaii]|uniref:Galectin n=1 Tax=Orchesella dallaii TaxID=48710 RepID=A0ABP1PKJ9_9HEXA
MNIFFVLLTFHACHSMLVNNPKIPFVTKLINGLSIRTKITITGRTQPGAFRFVATILFQFNLKPPFRIRFELFSLYILSFGINIRHGWTEEGGTILFHFNPRFDEPNVLTATHLDGLGWMNFSKSRFPKGNHFKKGNNFTVEIVCKEDQFNVIVDGVHFLVYKYILPLKIADILEIQEVRDRDVEIFFVDVSNSIMDTIVFPRTAKKDLNSSESDTSENIIASNSASPYAVVVLIFCAFVNSFFHGYFMGKGVGILSV